MSLIVLAGAIVAALLASLFFSTLSYSLRDLSRARLGEYLERNGKTRWLERTLRHVNDLIFVTAAARLLANVLVLLLMLRVFARTDERVGTQYFFASLTTLPLTLLASVAVPHALARHAPETIVGLFVRFLHVLRWALLPVTKIMHWVGGLVSRAAGAGGEEKPEGKAEQIEQDILSVVEEGEAEGVVDEQEREMIESVIEFRDTQAGQIMTPRPEVVALESKASLQEVKRTLEESGHSRIPVYEVNLDHIVGVLYARDLLKHLGLPPETFDIRGALRPPLYVPETKPLADLLQDFRLQKIHIAIVLDEYGGTVGLVTIEDILEELVGDIRDEHEPVEPAMLKRADDFTYEADARIYVDELNRLVGLALPEDAGYDTLGGFVSTTLAGIPATGTTFEHAGAKFTVLDAEPAKVNRVKIELPAQPAALDYESAPTPAAPVARATPEEAA